MTVNQAALTISLFAAMAALQFGGSHGVAHARHAALGAPELDLLPAIDGAALAESTADKIKQLADEGALQDPDTQAMLGMAAAFAPAAASSR